MPGAGPWTTMGMALPTLQTKELCSHCSSGRMAKQARRFSRGCVHESQIPRDVRRGQDLFTN